MSRLRLVPDWLDELMALDDFINHGGKPAEVLEIEFFFGVTFG